MDAIAQRDLRDTCFRMVFSRYVCVYRKFYKYVEKLKYRQLKYSDYLY